MHVLAYKPASHKLKLSCMHKGSDISMDAHHRIQNPGSFVLFLIISLKCNLRNLEIRVMVVAEPVANRNLEQSPRTIRLQFQCLREVIRGTARCPRRSSSWSQLRDSTTDKPILTCPSVEAAKPFCDSSMAALPCAV